MDKIRLRAANLATFGLYFIYYIITNKNIKKRYTLNILLNNFYITISFVKKKKCLSSRGWYVHLFDFKFLEKNLLYAYTLS